MLQVFGADASIESIKSAHEGSVHDIDVTFPDMPELTNKHTVELIRGVATHADIWMILCEKSNRPAFFIDGCPPSLTKKLYARLQSITSDVVLLVRTCHDMPADDTHKFARWTQSVMSASHDERMLQAWFGCTSLVLSLDTRMRETMQWHNASTRNAVMEVMDATIPPSKNAAKRIVNKVNVVADAEATCMAAFMKDDI